MRTALVLPLFAAVLLHAAAARAVDADPTNYLTVLATLKPGDTLNLAPGTYTSGLPISGLNGTEDAWITIAGPASGAPAIFEGNSCCNTVELVNTSYLAIERVTIDGKGIDGVFGVSAKNGVNNVVHHIRLEGNTFKGQGGSQQTVAISTKTPTYGWIVRGNVIDGAGTGIYFGNSNFAEPFVGGVIEHNLFKRTIGYNMQIKNQNAWPAHAALPDVAAPRTIIRHNVFLKDDTASPDGARPNLLVGGPPPSGRGADALVEIYGNVFVHNGAESLMQATGRVTIHDNLFVDASDVALRLQTHEGFPLIHARVYDNTFYAANRAIFFANAATEGDIVTGNLIFAAAGIEGQAKGIGDNIIESVAAASSYVASPGLKLGDMDFYPLAGQAETTPLDPAALADDTDHACDFNGTSRKDFAFRGAYAGAGTNPGWKPAEAVKPAVPCGSNGGGAGGGGAGSGGAPSGSGGAGGEDFFPYAPDDDRSGCGCRTAPSASFVGAPIFAALGLGLLARRRRVKARRA
ncbi:MYXO-CTERM sorting domain-containing protein [Polyangium aurulentum]|uniref:MYXO-CTERM sorting domain-containing protein n=1 Tax=Polyangium aurulentum TaxID=2567896 RepID=UPI0010ADB0DE|nr:MYXO-CTERM sorting domain-containing protein [Polyangium aurulentum]UQA58494.1 hypothetical protein E8A73_045865 [Polyangium aurulentum]